MHEVMLIFIREGEERGVGIFCFPLLRFTCTKPQVRGENLWIGEQIAPSRSKIANTLSFLKMYLDMDANVFQKYSNINIDT